MKKRTKPTVDQLVDQVADRIPNGHLMASSGSEAFLVCVGEHIDKQDAELQGLRQQVERLELEAALEEIAKDNSLRSREHDHARAVAERDEARADNDRMRHLLLSWLWNLGRCEPCELPATGDLDGWPYCDECGRKGGNRPDDYVDAPLIRATIAGASSARRAPTSRSGSKP